MLCPPACSVSLVSFCAYASDLSNFFLLGVQIGNQDREHEFSALLVEVKNICIIYHKHNSLWKAQTMEYLTKFLKPKLKLASLPQRLNSV